MSDEAMLSSSLRREDLLEEALRLFNWEAVQGLACCAIQGEGGEQPTRTLLPASGWRGETI